MRILLTGASSFTGLWFARALAEAGHHVVAPLRSAPAGYEGVRAERVQRLADCAEIVPGIAFGDDRFLDLLAASDGWDLLCHHAATVTDYRSPDFDVAAALAGNTRNVQPVLRRMAAQGCRGVVLTGSVFEQNEGAGNQPMRAFSPYGLSKALTAQVFDFWTGLLDLPFGKFVIPNAFGPFEEARFCAYLLRCWSRGETAEIRTPLYVRDNIHVDLLAKAYARFAEDVAGGRGTRRLNPSGYVETQGAFALRFAREIGARLGMDAPVRLGDQSDFSEPLVRINTDVPDHRALGWVEGAAWEALAGHYREMVAR